MIDYLQALIAKGEVSVYTAQELAMHTRHTHYFLAGIAVCMALLLAQYKGVLKQDQK